MIEADALTKDQGDPRRLQVLKVHIEQAQQLQLVQVSLEIRPHAAEVGHLVGVESQELRVAPSEQDKQSQGRGVRIGGVPLDQRQPGHLLLPVGRQHDFWLRSGFVEVIE